MLFIAWAILASLSVLAASKTSKGLTVRVETPSGAPRLVVNGRPVRARMFFGGSGSAPIRIEPNAAERQVAAVTAASGIPEADRIAGFTSTM